VHAASQPPAPFAILPTFSLPSKSTVRLAVGLATCDNKAHPTVNGKEINVANRAQ
jgi:hypothetical protein